MSATTASVSQLLPLSGPYLDSPTPARAGSAAYRAATGALFFGGFAAFAMLYGLQPLMPMFSATFGLSPAAASGVVSVSTGALALGLIPAGVVAQRFGAKPTMAWALALAAVLTLLAAAARDYSSILLLRALLGLALAGFPAVAMAYLSEEIEPASLGRAVGLLIAGNALGGMCGRLLAALLADWYSWRLALLVLGLVGALAAGCFLRSLPVSQPFRPRRFDAQGLLTDLKMLLSDGGLPWLFLLGALLMGCFVSLYNYLGYHLGAEPFKLRPSAIGLVFSLYVVGMFASAWAGHLADRFGRRHVLWIMVAVMAAGLALTMAQHLLPLIAGVALFTFGFFSAHSVASSWVGRRAMRAKALASSLYLTAYYLGSSLLGSASGLMWLLDGWTGVAALLILVLLASLLLTLRLRQLAPLQA